MSCRTNFSWILKFGQVGGQDTKIQNLPPCMMFFLNQMSTFKFQKYLRDFL